MRPPKHGTFDLAGPDQHRSEGIRAGGGRIPALPVGPLHGRGRRRAAPQFHYLESWLLPDLGLRANVFHFNPGYERDQDHYLDVATVTVDGDRWMTEDHYLDLVVRTDEAPGWWTWTNCSRRTGWADVQRRPPSRRWAPHSPRSRAWPRSHDLNAWLASTGVELSWRQA